MLKMTFKKNVGAPVPVLLCEVCQQPITDADMAMVAFEDKRRGIRFSDPAFLHKGGCDQQYKGGSKRLGGWQELNQFFGSLCAVIGMTQYQMKQMYLRFEHDAQVKAEAEDTEEIDGEDLEGEDC